MLLFQTSNRQVQKQMRQPDEQTLPSPQKNDFFAAPKTLEEIGKFRSAVEKKITSWSVKNFGAEPESVNWLKYGKVDVTIKGSKAAVEKAKLTELNKTLSQDGLAIKNSSRGKELSLSYSIPPEMAIKYQRGP